MERRKERLGMIMSPGILGNEKTSCTCCLRDQQHVEGKCALLLSTTIAWEQDISEPESRWEQIPKGLPKGLARRETTRLEWAHCMNIEKGIAGENTSTAAPIFSRSAMKH